MCTFLLEFFECNSESNVLTKERKWEISKPNTVCLYVGVFFFSLSLCVCCLLLLFRVKNDCVPFHISRFFFLSVILTCIHTHIFGPQHTNHLLYIELCQFNGFFSLHFRLKSTNNEFKMLPAHCIATTSLWQAAAATVLSLLMPPPNQPKNAFATAVGAFISLIVHMRKKCWEHDKLCAFSVSYKKISELVIKLNVSITRFTERNDPIVRLALHRSKNQTWLEYS